MAYVKTSSKRVRGTFIIPLRTLKVGSASPTSMDDVVNAAYAERETANRFEFDKSKFSHIKAIYFRAVMMSSAAAQTVGARLYNVTDAAIISSLTDATGAVVIVTSADIQNSLANSSKTYTIYDYRTAAVSFLMDAKLIVEVE